jgi:hypothetical protein
MSLDHEPNWYGRQGMWGKPGWNIVQSGEFSAGQAQRQRELFAAAERAKKVAEEAESARRSRLRAAAIAPPMIRPALSNLAKTQPNVSPVSSVRVAPLFHPPMHPQPQQEVDLRELLWAQVQKHPRIVAVVLAIMFLVLICYLQIEHLWDDKPFSHLFT